MPLKLKMILYNTLIVPIFNYADIIWGGCSKTQLRRIQVSQNFAARSILGSMTLVKNIKGIKVVGFG